MFKIEKIDHVGIAVPDLEEAKKFFSGVLGLAVTGEEIIADHKMKLVYLPCGDSEINLLQSVSPDGPIAKLIERKSGRAAVQHIALRVNDVQSAIDGVIARGGKMVHQKPRLGKEGSDIAFIDPKTSGDVNIHFSGAPQPQPQQGVK